MRWFTRRHPAGGTAEDLAAAQLERLGLTIVARNAATRFGEIDLVAELPSDGTVVFVEVKGRRGRRFGRGEEAVRPAKMRRMARLAAAYLETHHLGGRPVRFDVVAVDFETSPPELRHIPNAFALDQI